MMNNHIVSWESRVLISLRQFFSIVMSSVNRSRSFTTYYCYNRRS
jgi:hypothetical protein